ncbi:MAG: S8 family serine peptidase, partial [Candidatus Dadabacteria bacterium]
NIIAVAAIGQDGKLASFSNYGTNSVHLGAPGVGIWSSTAYNMLSSYSGTSMATPHVTGAVALYAATNNLTPTSAAGAAAIKNAITINVTPNILSGKCSSGGILNVSSF